MFNRFGSDESGMHMLFHGHNKHGDQCSWQWFLIAKKGDGLQVPATPASYLARKIIEGSVLQPGAMPCIELISLEEYLGELTDFKIKIHESLTN